jgi:hypothetical protein
MKTHWTYTTACHCCATERDHHIPTLEADLENGLSYESFEITVQRMPEPIWRKCRKCVAITRSIVVYYDEDVQPDAAPPRPCPFCGTKNPNSGVRMP